MANRSVFQMRIPERKKRRWQRAAERRGLKLSTFVMIAVDKEVDKELDSTNPVRLAAAPARSEANA